MTFQVSRRVLQAITKPKSKIAETKVNQKKENTWQTITMSSSGLYKREKVKNQKISNKSQVLIKVCLNATQRYLAALLNLKKK